MSGGLSGHALVLTLVVLLCGCRVSCVSLRGTSSRAQQMVPADGSAHKSMQLPAPPAQPPVPSDLWMPDWMMAKSQPTVPLSDITFVVMTSTAAHARLEAQRATWLSDVPKQNLLVMSDRDEPATGEHTTPAIRGKPSRADAQKHHFAGLEELLERNQLTKWVMLVDDDTWVNIPFLLQYAARFDSQQPIMMVHVWNRMFGPDMSFSGGAAALLTQRSAHLFGHALHSGKMPLPANDVNFDTHMAEWGPKLGITPVHTDLFWPDCHPVFEAGKHEAKGSHDKMAPQRLGMITLHFATDCMRNVQRDLQEKQHQQKGQ